MDKNIVALLIPILGTCIPIIAVAGYFWNENQRVQNLKALAADYLQRGQPVPPELLAALTTSNDASNHAAARRGPTLQGALTLLAIGLTLALALFLLVPQWPLWSLGLMPAAVGLVQLVVLRLQPPKPDGDAWTGR